MKNAATDTHPAKESKQPMLIEASIAQKSKEVADSTDSFLDICSQAKFSSNASKNQTLFSKTGVWPKIDDSLEFNLNIQDSSRCKLFIFATFKSWKYQFTLFKYSS